MSAKFRPPPSPLSAFHATYQYCLSAKFGDFSTPLTPSRGRPLRMVPVVDEGEVEGEVVGDGDGPLDGALVGAHHDAVLGCNSIDILDGCNPAP